MVIIFNNDYLERLFEGKTVTGKPRFNPLVIIKFKKTVLILKYADRISELRKFRGLNFERLKGDLKGFYSVSVDKQYRLILGIEKDTLQINDIIVVEDLSNHYR